MTDPTPTDAGRPTPSWTTSEGDEIATTNPLYDYADPTPTYDRAAVLEKQIDILTRAVHLLTASSKPTSEWLDKAMEKATPGTDYPGRTR